MGIRVDDLIKALTGGDNTLICPVDSVIFIRGEGVMGDVENLDGLPQGDIPKTAIEFCSRRCKTEYYRAGRQEVR